ncbi:hypothetical protein DENSPDRAFT_355176 [Dentipellis sp. KUC8613]|nr:hypothetical protein DENSPDRAFT_355176 [Dentipellis sp. KUC8613]
MPISRNPPSSADFATMKKSHRARHHHNILTPTSSLDAHRHRRRASTNHILRAMQTSTNNDTAGVFGAFYFHQQPTCVLPEFRRRRQRRSEADNNDARAGPPDRAARHSWTRATPSFQANVACARRFCTCSSSWGCTERRPAPPVCIISPQLPPAAVSPLGQSIPSCGASFWDRKPPIAKHEARSTAGDLPVQTRRALRCSTAALHGVRCGYRASCYDACVRFVGCVRQVGFWILMASRYGAREHACMVRLRACKRRSQVRDGFISPCTYGDLF